MVNYTPRQLREEFGSASWISPYQKIVAAHDERTGLVEIHEFHARGRCIGGSAWEVYHYPRVSSLVLKAKREGARNIFLVKPGLCQLNLVPGVAGAGMEKVEVSGGEVRVTYAGLAGGGVAATVCRGMADGVKHVEIYESGGGSRLGRAELVLPLKHKVIVGVDDTDKPEEGATWSLTNELAADVEEEGLADYLEHAIVQLYTRNPFKTTNCVSIALSFGVKPSEKQGLSRTLEKMLKRSTLSTNTGMVTYTGINPPEKLKRYARRAKTRMLTVKEAERTAEEVGVVLIPISGERGLIGALAAVGYANNPDEAVEVVA